MVRMVIVITVMVSLSSCVMQEVNDVVLVENTVTAESLLENSPLESTEVSGPDLTELDMLEMSPEMITFLDEKVDIIRGDREQLRHLAWAVIESGDFELSYEESTRTAGETFDKRRGNCLAFTNMFIAMARHLGLVAFFQEVDVPPSWTMTGQSYIYSQHINVYVRLERGFHQVVDFNIYEINIDHGSRLISDERAYAHFYNNIGAEQMLAGDSVLAYAYLRKSLKMDSTYAPAWINMGVLHRRERYPDWAEAAYLEALELEPANLMALSNLANLYEEQGRTVLAQQYQERVRSHRMRNPYYRYHKANEAFIEGDYTTAIKDLKYAIRLRKNEDRFYYLLSLCYLMSGDRDEAQKWMEKAEEVARINSDREKYHYKLDLLKNLNNL